MEYSIKREVKTSDTEAELGGFSTNCQTTTPMQTTLVEMGHPQPTTPVSTETTASNSIVDGPDKQKISRAIDMIFYSVCNIIKQVYF